MSLSDDFIEPTAHATYCGYPKGGRCSCYLRLDEVSLPTRYEQSHIEGGIEWYMVDAGPLEQDLTEDCSCARCGSSVERVQCWNCGGEGYSHHNCGEDCCCCLYPEDNVICDICCGTGGWLCCVSTPEYCEANPIPRREHIKSTAMNSEAWNG